MTPDHSAQPAEGVEALDLADCCDFEAASLEGRGMRIRAGNMQSAADMLRTLAASRGEAVAIPPEAVPVSPDGLMVGTGIIAAGDWAIPNSCGARIVDARMAYGWNECRKEMLEQRTTPTPDARVRELVEADRAFDAAEADTNEIRVGDKVRTGVYVLGRWTPMWLGVVTAMSDDKSVALVDVMGLHGGAPRIHHEQTSHLRKEPDNDHSPVTGEQA